MTLKDRLVERIRARGPMTFADFMDAALYDPQDGYYTAHPSGYGAGVRDHYRAINPQRRFR